MKLRKLFPSSLFLLICSALNAQSLDYAEMMNDSSANLKNISSVFEKAWQGRDHKVKGKGWKAFKRFEYQHENQLMSGGNLNNGFTNWTEYKKYIGGSVNSNSAGKLNGSNQSLAAGNWAYIGPANGISSGGGAGRTLFVRFDPTNSNIMYCGSPAGGLWKSTNGGTSWVVVADQIASLGCSDLVIDPTNTNIMYLATGDADAKDTYSTGVLKSTDGGITWNTTGILYATQATRTISKLLINPNNTLEVWAATSVGLWKTIDGGINWFLAKTGAFRDIEFKPGHPNTVYAAGGSSFFYTTNSGATWTLTSMGFTGTVGRTCIAVTPADSNYVYLLAGIPGTGTPDDYGFRGIAKSTDGGQSFTVMATSPNIMGWSTNGSDQGGQAWYDIALACSPTNKNTIFTGGVNVWKSTNGGATMTNCSNWWGSGSTYVHADVHALEFLPGSGTTIFAGCDGGVFKSTNTGTAWTDVSTGLQIAQQYNIGVSQTNASLNITGWQDNGTNLQNGTACSEVMGGDGFECIISHANAAVMYGEVYYGDISKSTNGGTNFSNIVSSGGTGVDEDGAWNTPYIMHPTNANTLLVGKHQIYRSTNAGTSWTQLGAITGAQNLSRLAYAPSNPNYIYATSGGGFWVSTNGGTSFTDRSNLLPGGLTYMAVNPTHPDIIFVTVGGTTSGQKVYVSTNAGQTWLNYSTGLPNVTFNTIVYQSGTNAGLYAGCDIGVFYRDSTMSNWIAYSDNLPNVKVDELEIQVSAGKLRAATYGRGMWETDLYTPPVSAPVCAFSSNRTKACVNGDIDFYDLSTNLPTTWNWTFQNGIPSTSTLQYPIVHWSAPGTYNVKLIASNGIGADSVIASGYVTVYPNPVAFAGNDTTICKGDTIQLNATGGSAYMWTQANTLNNPFISNPLAFPASSKTYSVTVADTNGCSDGDSKFVTVIQPFVAPSINANGSLLTASPNGAGYTYQWFYNGNPIAGSTSSTCLADSIGLYTVLVTDTFGCSAQTSGAFSYVGIKDLGSFQGWNYFPNPAKEFLNVTPAKNYTGEITINVYDLGGNLVRSEKRTVKDGSAFQIKTPIAAGTYVMHILDANGKDSGAIRFVVVKD